MKTRKSAVNKVIKKLNAVRVTLPAEERKAFDELVASKAREDEVEAHVFQGKTSAGKTSAEPSSGGSIAQ